MVDLIVKQNKRGKWVIKSDFNGRVLDTFDFRDRAVEVARDRQYHGDEDAVWVKLDPRKME